MLFRRSPRRTVTSSVSDHARMVQCQRSAFDHARLLQCQRGPIIMWTLCEREGELHVRCGLHPMTMGMQRKAR